VLKSDSCVLKLCSSCRNQTQACRNHSRKCRNHNRKCQNYTRVCGNYTLRVEITLIHVEIADLFFCFLGGHTLRQFHEKFSKTHISNEQVKVKKKNSVLNLPMSPIPFYPNSYFIFLFRIFYNKKCSRALFSQKHIK
jgi:hypothetical protein